MNVCSLLFEFLVNIFGIKSQVYVLGSGLCAWNIEYRSPVANRAWYSLYVLLFAVFGARLTYLDGHKPTLPARGWNLRKDLLWYGYKFGILEIILNGPLQPSWTQLQSGGTFVPPLKSGYICSHFGIFSDPQNRNLTMAAAATIGHFKSNQGMEPFNWTLFEMFSCIFDHHSGWTT